MKNRVLGLFALVMAVVLLATGLAFAEGDLEIDAGIATEGYEGLDEYASIDLDGAALVSDDPAEAESTETNASEVPINKTNFPAADFRNYVKANFDKDGNGKLSKAEAGAVREICLRTEEDGEAGVNKKNCPNLKGIERFPNLEKLECVECKTKALDVSKNTKLKILECSFNQLTVLNVSKNTKLVVLNCAGNQLSSLNIAKNTKLKELWCGMNKLTKLDVSKNKKLEVLHCWYNKLTKLDVTKNANLKQLRFHGNRVKKLDISKNAKLTNLNCGENQLKALNTTKNTKLIQINCWDNQLTSLDVSKNPKLIALFTYGNKIKTIDLKNNKTIRGYLKNKMWKEDEFIAWSSKGDDEEWGLGIDYGTKLTNGSKVLYEG